MSWKQILTKGLPVFIIATIIVVIAVITSRKEPQPELSSDIADDLVVDFKGLKVSNQKLYDMMKFNYGLYSLLDQVDRTLLKDYEDKIDLTELEDKIATEKEDDEEQFYKDMISLGIITGNENDTDKEAKIKEYYKIEFLQKAYAKEQAIESLDSDNDGDIKDEDSVKDAIDDLKTYRDMCVIPLRYDTRPEALAVLDDTLNNLTGDDLKAEFISLWTEQNEDTTVSTQDTFFTDFDCEYERVVYKNANSTYRDFIFNKANYNKDGKYNGTPVNISNKYMIVFYVNQADIPTDENKMVDYVSEQLVADKLTTSYIKDEMIELRKNQKLKIYDSAIAESYTDYVDDDFEGSKLKNATTVATIKNLNGETITFTTDMLYNRLKKELAVDSLLHMVNYYALSTIDDIKLTKDEIAKIKDEIADEKTKFLAGGYAKEITWSEYLTYQYRVSSEKQFIKQKSIPDLQLRYILGYDVDETSIYPGVASATDEDINEAAAKWFKIQASHILITFDDNDDKARSKDEAELMAKQIINGCSATEIADETCYIEYEFEDDTKTFNGLKNVLPEDFNTVFEELAKKYSEDGSAESGGDIGYFTPGEMVKPFEEAAQDIANRNKVFTEEPVESEFGFHVIYVTDTENPPAKPANFDELSDEEKENSTDTAVKNYYAHLKSIKKTIEQSRKTEGFINKILAELRDNLEFEFLDDTIQAHYEAIQALDKAYEE